MSTPILPSPEPEPSPAELAKAEADKATTAAHNAYWATHLAKPAH